MVHCLSLTVKHNKNNTNESYQIFAQFSVIHFLVFTRENHSPEKSMSSSGFAQVENLGKYSKFQELSVWYSSAVPKHKQQSIF